MLNDFRIVIFINIYKNVKTLNYSSPRDLVLKTVSYNKFIIVIIRGCRYVSYNENYTEATVQIVIGSCSRLRRLWNKCEKLKCKTQEIVTCYLKMRISAKTISLNEWFLSCNYLISDLELPRNSFRRRCLHFALLKGNATTDNSNRLQKSRNIFNVLIFCFITVVTEQQ